MKYAILIGFRCEHLLEMEELLRELKEAYPDQEWNIMKSDFPQYDFILCGFAGNLDQAHRIGLKIVKGLKPHLRLLYWVKKIEKEGD